MRPGESGAVVMASQTKYRPATLGCNYGNEYARAHGIGRIMDYSPMCIVDDSANIRLQRARIINQ